MKNTVIRTIGFVGAGALAAHLFAAVPPAQKEVDRLLTQISANAAVTAKHADRLNSFVNTAGWLSHKTHAVELNGARSAINAMGADYRQLQALRASALPWQQSVIDRLEPVLAGVAGHASDAIEALNTERRMPTSETYRDAVGKLYDDAQQARNLISVNRDYAQAREELNRFDASPLEPVESVAAAQAISISSMEVRSLERRVRSELLKLPWYGVFDHLAFQVNGDQVRLTGEVSWPGLKGDAERAVRDVEGVAGVTNQIRVLPVSLHDDRIRLATYRAIYGQESLARYGLNPHPPIRIIVENGHVTLKGVVGNQMDRTMAYMQANKVPGVFSVTNSLQLGS